MEPGERVQMEGERMLGEKQQWRGVDQPSHWPDEGKPQRQGWRRKAEDTTHYRAGFGFFFGFLALDLLFFSYSPPKCRKRRSCSVLLDGCP